MSEAELFNEVMQLRRALDDIEGYKIDWSVGTGENMARVQNMAVAALNRPVPTIASPSPKTGTAAVAWIRGLASPTQSPGDYTPRCAACDKPLPECSIGCWGFRARVFLHDPGPAPEPTDEDLADALDTLTELAAGPAPEPVKPPAPTMSGRWPEDSLSLQCACPFPRVACPDCDNPCRACRLASPARTPAAGTAPKGNDE